jgi:hypothetical protein
MNYILLLHRVTITSKEFWNSQEYQICFREEDKSQKNKEGYQTSSRGYIQEVYFLLVFALLERVKCVARDRGMHVQKNVFESIIGTLLDIKGKQKNGSIHAWTL